MNPLFTIGHSVLQLQHFLDLLLKHSVQVIADVRSSPVSGRFPHFSKENLKSQLRTRGIQYVFLGKELGARRKEREAYEGMVATYERIAKLNTFVDGLERIRTGAANYRVSLLCAEKDPLQCHRTILVCRHIKADFQDRIFHILDSGELESHGSAEARLIAEEGLDLRQTDAFNTAEDVLNRAYEKRGLAIAYQEQVYDNEDLHDRIY